LHALELLLQSAQAACQLYWAMFFGAGEQARDRVTWSDVSAAAVVSFEGLSGGGALLGSVAAPPARRDFLPPNDDRFAIAFAFTVGRFCSVSPVSGRSAVADAVARFCSVSPVSGRSAIAVVRCRFLPPANKRFAATAAAVRRRFLPPDDDRFAITFALAVAHRSLSVSYSDGRKNT
jgi:hypothetical protein